MAAPLVIAAALLIAVGIAHSYLGERFVLRRLLRRDDLPHLFGSDWFTRRTLRFAWHLTTIAWFGFAVVLLVLADHFGDPAPSIAPLTSGGDPLITVGLVVAIVFALHAVVTAVVSRGRHLAWPAFAAVSILTWLAI